MADPLWHYSHNGAQQPPISEVDLRQRAADGRLSPGDLVWREGMAQWQSAGTVPGLFPASTVFPPPPIAYYSHRPNEAPPPGIGQDAGVRMLLPVGRSGWAIAAGYLGLFSCLFFPAPIALIISIIAIKDIKKHPDRHGMGRAIFGLVMGISGTLAFAFWLATAKK